MFLTQELSFRPDTVVFRWDKKPLKKALREGAKIVQKESRRLIARRAISGPGYDSGTLSRSIKVWVARSGMYARIQPKKTAEMKGDYYPAFLYYGTSRGLEKRANYMEEALKNQRNIIRQAIIRSLRDSLQVK